MGCLCVVFVCVCVRVRVCVCALHTTIGTQAKALVAVVSDKRTLHSHADVRYVYYVKEFTLYGMCGCFVCLHAYPMYHVGTCATWSFTYPFTKRCMHLLGNLPEGLGAPVITCQDLSYEAQAIFSLTSVTCTQAFVQSGPAGQALGNWFVDMVELLPSLGLDLSFGVRMKFGVSQK